MQKLTDEMLADLKSRDPNKRIAAIREVLSGKPLKYVTTLLRSYPKRKAFPVTSKLPTKQQKEANE